MTVRTDTEAAVVRRYVTQSAEGQRHRKRLLDALEPILTEIEAIQVELLSLDARVDTLEEA